MDGKVGYWTTLSWACPTIASAYMLRFNSSTVRQKKILASIYVSFYGMVAFRYHLVENPWGNSIYWNGAGWERCSYWWVSGSAHGMYTWMTSIYDFLILGTREKRVKKVYDWCYNMFVRKKISQNPPKCRGLKTTPLRSWECFSTEMKTLSRILKRGINCWTPLHIC